MGSQQLVLYVLGVIMILVVVALGVFLFREHQISSNKDAIILDMQIITADLEQYALRPESMGGGEGSYDGYEVPRRFASNDNGTYSLTIVNAPPKGHGYAYGHDRAKGFAKNHGNLTLIGTSRNGFGTVTMSINDSTATTTLAFTGAFQ